MPGDPAHNLAARLSGAPLKIAAIYFLVGGLWILFSDQLLPLMFSDQATITRLSIYKGWAYVAVTALLIHYLVDRALGQARAAQEELRGSEAQYRLIVDTANEGVWRLDQELRTAFVNRKMAGMLGYAPEEMLGQPLDAFLLPEDRESFLAGMEQSREGLRETYEQRLRHRDGRSLWFQVSAAPLLDDQGRFLGFFGMLTNIDQRRRMEDDLRENRRFLSDLIENSGALIFVKDRQGLYQLVNHRWEEVTGLAREAVLGRNDEELFPGEVGHRFRANDLEAMEAQRVVESEEILDDASGRRYFIAIKFPVRDSQGQVRGVCGMATEITERKQAEEALAKRLIALSRPLDDPEGLSFHDLFNLEDIQRVQDLFAQATGVASIITQPDGAPITRPSNFQRLCGEIIRETELGLRNCLASDAAMGRHHPEGPLVQPCLSGGLWNAGASITVGGKHLANWLIGQVRNQRQDDGAMRAYARAIGVDEDAFMAAYREVPVMAEEKFRQVADALFVLANQLSNVAYQNVQQARFITERDRAEAEKAKVEVQLLQAQKMEAIGTLAGGIAHDFNNILGAILGYAEIVRDDAELGRTRVQDVDQIIAAAERAKSLVQQILTSSRKVEPERRPLDLNQEVRRAMELLAHTLPKMISTRLSLAPGLNRVFADPGQLSQVMLNLTANAAQAMPEGGVLTIATQEVTVEQRLCHTCGELFSGPWVTLTIADTGQGIPPDDIPRIFDPFFTTKDVGKGTGLGLSMVHGIIQGHGGHIECQSQLGQGATFTIYLAPCSRRGGEVAEETPDAENAFPGGETILLVDDEAPLRNMGERLLTPLGYQVLTASSGEEALKVYQGGADAIDLVIMDLGMPGMGGYKALQAILAQDPAASVVIASGYSAQDQVRHALEAGAAGYVAKPFRRLDLLAAVRAALERPRM